MSPATFLKDAFSLVLDMLRTRLARRSGIYFGATLVNVLVPFMVLPILARALGPTNYGFVGSFSALTSMAAVAVGLNTYGMLTPAYFKTDKKTFADTISACLTVVSITAPIMMLGFVLFGPLVGRYFGIGRSWQWAIVVSAAGQFVMMIALATCQIRGEAMRFGTLQISNTVINVTLSLLLVVGFGWGWQGRAVAQSVAAVAVGGASFLFLWRTYDILHLPEKKNLMAALRFGLPLVPHTVVSAFRVSFDRLIIGAVLGFTGAGKYFAAYQIANVLTLICTAINQAWTPWLFQRLANGTGDERVQVVRVTYIVLALYFGAALGLMIVGPVLLPILVGPQFGDAGKLLIVLAPAAAFNGGYLLFTNYIFHAERTGWLTVITCSTAALQALAAYVLVHKIGIWGVAYATLGGAVVYMVSVWIVAAHLVPMGWFSLLHRRAAARSPSDV